MVAKNVIFMIKTIHVAYNLARPMSIPNLFGNWLGAIHYKLKGQIYVGDCAIL
jgi:hypothetical protein